MTGTGKVHDLGRSACRACGRAARQGQHLCADDEVRYLASPECARANEQIDRRPTPDKKANDLVEKAMQEFVGRRRRETCPHARKYFYRAGWAAAAAGAGGKRLEVQIVERCQDCGADVRGGARVPLQELREEHGLEPWALDADPWAAPRRAAGRGGRRA